MAETPLTPQTGKDPFAAISAGNLDFTWAAGSTDGNTFACTGRQILLLWNSDGANPYTATVTSQVDEKNRTGDITAYSLAAGDFAHWYGGLTNSAGWKDATGLVHLDCENAAIKYAVLTLPPGYPK